MSTEIVENSTLGARSLEKVLIQGDLSSLNPAERMLYYTTLCKTVGLNPLARPFEYISLQGKLTLYAKRDCTDQLRKIHGVSITIVDKGIDGDCYNVIARATDSSGRTDESTGSVSFNNLKGDARSNAIMKAETKAKRRVTLSICGLGMLDESEVSSIPQATVVTTPIDVTPKKHQKQEEIGETVVIDIISNILSEIKSLLKEDKIQEAWMRCECLPMVHKTEIWSLLDNKERVMLKSYAESNKEERDNV